MKHHTKKEQQHQDRRASGAKRHPTDQKQKSDMNPQLDPGDSDYRY
jgi:hypothetical protein